MKKNIKKIGKRIKKKPIFLVAFSVFFSFFLFIPRPAAALWNPLENLFISGIQWAFQGFNAFLGIFINIVTKGLVVFTEYNGFIHEPAIQQAWEIVLSFCNMFFILALLIIAFANILNIDSYKIKNTLPKLVIMAILINFSLMICGFLIDISQIFMMTFVSALGSTGGSYINTLGVNEAFTPSEIEKWGKEINSWSVFIASLLSTVFLIIALVVLVCVLIIVIMRIAYLWAYVVLSPLAFLLSAFPGGKAFASKWWDRFVNQLIIGPILMFFVWLSIYIVNNGNYKTLTDSKDCFGPMAIFCPDAFLPFFIAIAMLSAGLIISQELGGAGGEIAGKGIGKIQAGKEKMTKGVGNVLRRKSLEAGQAAGRTALGISSAGVRGLGGLTGSDTLTTLGETGSSWRRDLLKNRDDRQRDRRLEMMRKMGMKEKTLEKAGEFSETSGARYAKSAALGGLGLASGGLVGAGVFGTGLGHAAATWGRKRADEKEAQRKEGRKEAGQRKEDRIRDAERARNEDEGYQEALRERDNALARLESQDLPDDVYRNNVDRVNQRFEEDNRVREAEEAYQRAVDLAKEGHSSEVKGLDKKSFSEKIYSAGWSPLEGWHPQKVTKAAAKKGADDYEKAKSEISGYGEGGEKIQNNGPNNWYSSSGQSSAQKVKLDTLTTDDPKSRKALNNIAEEISSVADQISRRGIDSVPKEKLNRVDNFKRGVAAWKKGDNDDGGRLDKVIEALNKVPDKDGENKTVDFYTTQDFIIKS